MMRESQTRKLDKLSNLKEHLRKLEIICTHRRWRFLPGSNRPNSLQALAMYAYGTIERDKRGSRRVKVPGSSVARAAPYSSGMTVQPSSILSPISHLEISENSAFFSFCLNLASQLMLKV